MLRLFVGLSLPETLAQRLEILGGGLPGARWVAARNLHVTLRFVGEVDEAAAADLDQALDRIDVPAFALWAEGFGTFGGRHPHALWTGIPREPGLLRLQERIESACQRTGLAAEGRKYTPHVTLAWCKGAATRKVQEAIIRMSPFRSETFPVTRFHLYRSHLGQGGAEYEILKDYPLDSKSCGDY